MAARILSISYDPTLLQTRHLLLEGDGYLVSSTDRFEEAMDLCNQKSFDLVIIGHSIPEEDREQFVRELRARYAIPVFVLLRYGESPFAAADYNLDVSTGPMCLVSTVRKILFRRAQAA